MRIILSSPNLTTLSGQGVWCVHWGRWELNSEICEEAGFVKEEQNDLLRGLTRKPIAHSSAIQQRKATGESLSVSALEENFTFS